MYMIKVELLHVIYRKLMVWFKSRSVGQDKEDKVYTHWEQDYNLADQPKLGLFDEYLEMGKFYIQSQDSCSDFIIKILINISTSPSKTK